MEREEIVKILQGLVKKTQRLTLGERDSFEKSGMDSLDQLELCMHTEKQFSIVIEDAEVLSTENIGDLADIVLSKIG